MKMKKRLLGILLSFALMLTMMPVLGLSLTAYADNTETLLTTITPTGKTTYSETTSGVVSVTATNVTDYDARFGWLWYDEGSLSVTAKEGYNITKVIFKQNEKSPFTDLSAPFELHFARSQCQENPRMDGVTSIEVYTGKAAQTITASDVTATYGDTDKSVSASVTTPATGGGAISYTVKDGSGDYIDVASDGKLTIKKVPPTDGKAYVIVKAAATDDYAETTKEVTVTISKAEATVAAKDQSIMVDGTVPDLSAPVLDTHYSVTGLVGTDTLTTAPTLVYQKNGSPATPDSATAGTYDIVPSGASAGDNYNISYTNGMLTISEKPSATVKKAPTAKTLTYNGSMQALVTAGEAEGGEMQYALGTATEATEPYTTSIPSKTDAGTYYVWYKAVGDAYHTDSATNVVKVTIAQKPADTTPVGSIHNVGGSNYIVTSAGTVSLLKANSKKSFTLPATVVIDGKTFSVTGIYAKAFKGTKEKTLIVKTKGLTKASVKGSLKGSKIKKVKVKVGKKKENKKYVKKYKKYFTKKNCGKKVRVRR